jgi:hypothetical protein
MAMLVAARARSLFAPRRRLSPDPMRYSRRHVFPPPWGADARAARGRGHPHVHLRPHSLGGLYEKLFLAIELVWLLVVSLSIVSPRERRPVSAVGAG